MLSEDVVRGTCALFPLVSALLFVIYQRGNNDIIDLIGTQQPVGTEKPEPPAKDNLSKTGFALLLLLVWCYGFFFARMHTIWLPAQESWGVISIQLASASGAILSCMALALIGVTPSRRMSVLLCECLILVFVFFSIYLSGIDAPGLETVYLCPFNAAQKTLFYLCFLTCLVYRSLSSKMLGFCAMFGVFRSSTVILQLLTASTPAAFADIVTDTINVAAMAVATLLLVVVMARPHLLPQLVPAKLQKPEESPASEADTVAQHEREQYRAIAFLFLFAQKHSLTQREMELIPHLMGGLGAKEIAEELSITQATAKTHIRNIYQKLGIHSHAELLKAIECDRASLFERLPEWNFQ